MIKVLHVVGTLDVGGIEKWLTNFINFCDYKKNEDFEIFILSLDKDKKAILNQIKIKNDNVYFVYSNNIISRIFSIVNIIKEIRPNYIHLHPGYSTGIYAFFIKLISKSKVLIHSHSDRRRTESDLKIKRMIYIKLMKFFINRFSDYRLAVSKEAGDSLFVNDYIIKNCGVPDTIVPNDFNSPELESLKGHNIIHVGRDSEAKNYPFLIELSNKFKDELDYNFIFIGANLDKYKDILVNDLKVNNAFFLGFHKSPEKIIKKYGSIFIMPSLWEGLPLSAIEAQKSGVYSLLSNCITKECDIGASKFLPLDINVWEKEIKDYFASDYKFEISHQTFSLLNDYNFYKSIYFENI